MTNKEAISNLEELYPVVSEEKKQAIDKAIEALKLSDEVVKASEHIGARYYGPDNCSRCKHAKDKKQAVEGKEFDLFCEYWGICVDSSDTCHYYEEVKHD